MHRIVGSLVFSISALALVACGGGGSDGGNGPLPGCPSGKCGQESFRRAVPQKAAVRIDGPQQGRKRSAAPALDSPSEALVIVEEHIAEIDELVDDIFTDLEEVAGTTPEIEEEGEHLWRVASDFEGFDELLHITTADDATFEIEYLIVPDGAGPDAAEPVIHGTVILADDEQDDFDLTIDLDALDEVAVEGMSGDIVIAEMPFEAGERELWYDYHEVDFGDGDVENGLTTYWDFGDAAGGAIEFFADWADQTATAYARWDDEGGRYDHHTAYADPAHGQVDEIQTSCWGADGAEEFSGEAMIDAAGDYYGVIEGDEADCDFTPVADHPNPGDDFDDLPGEGEWDDLALNPV